ncbi:MAG: UbiA family prenyltransferase [Rubrivivax sp.]|nr:UbiA family prenyltransferase [Rubrivivax sp.]
MKLATALQLGRISNLPTVWSNVLVGALLAGGVLGDLRIPLLMLSLSAFYIGGMFLNDAFDRAFDAKHRPERPIPSGQATAAEVFVWGYGLMAAGGVGVGVAGAWHWRALVSAAALAAAIVLYNAHHKGNPLSPLVMGLCRVCVVTTAGFCLAPVLPAAVLLAAAALLCHLIGLTYIAKQEHLERVGSLWPLAFLALPVAYGAVLASAVPLVWPLLALYFGVLIFALSRLRRRGPGDVPRAVVTLIAGMSVLDAVLLAGGGQTMGAVLAVIAFVLTLRLQRWVSGT